MKIVFNSDAEYIWTSKNGNHYIDEVLREKPSVITKAQLQRIAHNNAANDTYSLRIGRYKINGNLENDNPKSVLTLDNEELGNLIAFIERCFGALKAGVDSFIPLDGDETTELLRKFKSLTISDHDKITALIDSGLITKNASSIIEHTIRLESLKEFKESLNEDYLEQYWQTWFENNKWILGSEFSKILTEREIDSEHIADYLMKSNDGFLDIVEIKKPNGMKFWANSLDHNNHIPSVELVKAITQCRNYLFEIECKSDSKEFSKRVDDTPIVSPRCLLVFGRSNDWNNEQRLAFRLLNSSLNGITIITYDQLYERAINMIGFVGDSD